MSKLDNLLLLALILFLVSCSCGSPGDDGQQIASMPEGDEGAAYEQGVDPTGTSGSRDLSEDSRASILEQASLLMRTVFLKNSLIAWGINQEGQFEIPELEDVSNAGFLPIWCMDTSEGEPIEILREADPASSQIAYWPVAGEGWDFSLIKPGNINEEGAGVSYLESSASQKQIWEFNLMTPPGADNKTHMSSDEWDLMLWSMSTACEVIIDFYIADNESMPESLQDLLNGQFFINEDYLNAASELIIKDESEQFEIGVVPDLNFLYTEFVRRDNQDEMILVRHYNIGSGEYDVTDPDRWEWVFTGLPEGAQKMVLLSTEMLENQEDWVSEVDHLPLSAFYNSN